MIYGPTLTNYNLFDDVKEFDNDIQRSCCSNIRKHCRPYLRITRSLNIVVEFFHIIK